MGHGSFRVPSAILAASAAAAVALLGAAPTGAIYVTSLPSGADVWLDGTYLGRAPVVADGLPIGSHHLTLIRAGWTTEDLAVEIAPAQTQTTSVVMVRDGKTSEGSGTIALHAADKLGPLALDGVPAVPKDGVLVASAGTHDLTITGPQGKQTRSVTVYPRTRTDVLIVPDPSPNAAVIAPADDYLPAGAYKLEGTRLVVRYNGHDVVAKLGATSYTVDHKVLSFDAAPTVIHNRIYLPLDLLTMLAPPDAAKK